ncbi:MAG: hypothetical protein J6X46_07455 [Prevotella sp.]|nr:hypothetical protein [Prevotella sp.]
MRKLIIILLAVLLSTVASAQKFKHSGTSAKDVAPKGWKIDYEPTGDLNKDGIADLVIMATPDSAEHIVNRTDGSVYNNNQPVLAIYWGTADGRFNLYKEYPTVLSIFDDELMAMEGLMMECTNEISINDRGVLRIKNFSDQAGSIVLTIEELYRYQNGDFELIGKLDSTYDRDTQSFGEASYNYSTGKVKFTKSFMDDEKDDEVSWGTCQKSPKKKLGQQ